MTDNLWFLIRRLCLLAIRGTVPRLRLMMSTWTSPGSVVSCSLTILFLRVTVPAMSLSATNLVLLMRVDTFYVYNRLLITPWVWWTVVGLGLSGAATCTFGVHLHFGSPICCRLSAWANTVVSSVVARLGVLMVGERVVLGTVVRWAC